MSREDDIEEAKAGSFGLVPKGVGQGRRNEAVMELRRQEIMRLCLMGYTLEEISKELGFKPRTIAKHLAHPDVERFLEERENALRKAAFRRVKLQAEKLMGVYIEIATNPKAKGADRIRAASAALDRIGITGGPNVNLNVEVGPRMTTGELIARAESLKEELLKLEAESKKEELALEAEIIEVESES